MTLQRRSSWPFVDQKRFSPRPLVDSPNYDLAKIFFVVLRGPSWIKRFSPRPFVDSPNNDLAKVFFVVLRGPSWIKRGFLCDHSWTSPNYDLAKVFFVVPRGPSWIKKVFLRGTSWIDHILILQISVQTNVNEPLITIHWSPMRVLLLYKDYFPVVGGIENHIRLLAQGLRTEGVDAPRFSSPNTGPATLHETIDGVPVTKTGRQAHILSTPISLPFFAELRRQAASADLVHLHAPYPPAELAQTTARTGQTGRDHLPQRHRAPEEDGKDLCASAAEGLATRRLGRRIQPPRTSSHLHFCTACERNAA